MRLAGATEENISFSSHFLKATNQGKQWAGTGERSHASFIAAYETIYTDEKSRFQG